MRQVDIIRPITVYPPRTQFIISISQHQQLHLALLKPGSTPRTPDASLNAAAAADICITEMNSVGLQYAVCVPLSLYKGTGCVDIRSRKG